MKNDKKTLYLLTFIISVLIILVLSSTYGFFKGQISKGAIGDILAQTGTTDSLMFYADDPISIRATVDNFGRGKGNLSEQTKAIVSLKANNATNEAHATYNVFVIIEENSFQYTSINKDAEVLLNITDPRGNKITNITHLNHLDNGFDITTRSGAFLVASDYEIDAPNDHPDEWTLEVTLVNLDEDQRKNMGKSLSVKLYVTQDKIGTYELAKLNTINSNSSPTSIEVFLDTQKGTSDIDKYYVAIEKVEVAEEIIDDALAFNENKIKKLANDSDNLKFIELDSPNYVFEDLESDSTYRIYSFVVDKQGIRSNEYVTVVETKTYIIPKVNGLSYNVTLNSIEVTVDAIGGTSDVIKYYYSNNGGETYEESSSNIYTFTGLNDTSDYNIKVKVEDNKGKFSNEYFDVVGTEVYINPTVTKVESTTTYNSINVNVTAEGGTSKVISHYLYSIDDGETWVTGGQTRLFEGLTDEKNYVIGIKAVDENGRESNIYYYDATTDAYKLPVIDSVVGNAKATSMTINVTAHGRDGNIVGYKFSKDNGGSYVDNDSSSFRFKDLSYGTTFYVKVKAVDENGRESSEYALNVTTTAELLADYIKSTYGNDDDLLHHDEALENGANDDSYRYTGANPNNYVCFGSTAEVCPDDNLYRIIGVFGSQVKLIKYDYANEELLGKDGDRKGSYYYYGKNSTNTYYKGNLDRVHVYYWNNRYDYENTSVTSSNNWNESRLNTINLNTNYLNNIGSIWSQKIAITEWQVGGLSGSNGIYTNVSTAYSYELGENKISKILNAKVGLMYLSEYYYSASPTYWTYPGLTSSSQPNADGNYGADYDYRAAVNSNWMYMGLSEWPITRVTNDVSTFHLYADGSLGWSTVYNNSRGIRPTFNLVDYVMIDDGEGTENNPYRIVVNDVKEAERPRVTNVIANTDINAISLTASATAGTSNIKFYYYSLDGANWEKSTSNTYSFTGVPGGITYYVEVKVVDEMGRESDSYSISVTSKSSPLADACRGENMASCLKNNYTKDSSIYHHDETLENGAKDDSYRYAGGDPSNYVCFGSELNPCPVDNLYRIIGIFGDQVKLIKYDYANEELLGTDGDRKTNYGYTTSNFSGYKGAKSFAHVYYWNDANDYANTSTTSPNNWNESRLNTVNLNTDFLNNIGSKWSDKIATTEWYVGGVPYTAVAGAAANAYNAYTKELGSEKVDTTYNAKIGLIYISEYYYSALPKYWTLPGYTGSSYLDANGNYGEDYDYRSSSNDNWVNIGLHDWTITRNSSTTVSSYTLGSDGSLGWTYVYSNARGIRPTFSLASFVILDGGSGVKADPYRIRLNDLNEDDIPKITNISTSDVTATSFKVSATASVGSGDSIKNYFFSKDSGVSWMKSTSNSYTFTNVDPSTTYNVLAKVVTNYGRESAPSLAVVITKDYVNPSVSITSTSSTQTSITINAQAVAGSSDIAKYMFSTDGGTNWLTATTSSLTFAQTITGLSVGTTYDVLVKVVDTRGYESTVVSKSVSTVNYTNPGVTISSTSQTSNSITVTVKGTPGTNQIAKYMFSNNGGSSYTTVTTTASTYSYTFTGLNVNTTYNIRVKSVDSSGYQSSYASKSVTTNTAVLATYIKSLYTYQGSNGLYYHISSLANSAGDGSYRYTGTDPNNYVCFGSTATICPSDNLYRIIGVFGNQAKLIKADFATTTHLGTSVYVKTSASSNYTNYYNKNLSTSVQEFYWHTTSDINRGNIWPESYLNNSLNSNYINNLGTTWSGKIANATWYVGGISQSMIKTNATPQTVYNNEVGSNRLKTYTVLSAGNVSFNATYSAKIGLMYISDYLYAALPKYWTYNPGYQTGTDYESSINDNWMHIGAYEWTMTRTNGISNLSYRIGQYGLALYTYISADATVSGVRPAFYLNSSVNVVGGNGSKSSPYRIN